MEESIFSISEASKYVGVFPLTLRNWEKRGRIRPFRTPGGHRRFRKSDLDLLMSGAGVGEGRLQEAIKKLERITADNENKQAIESVLADLRGITEKL